MTLHIVHDRHGRCYWAVFADGSLYGEPLSDRYPGNLGMLRRFVDRYNREMGHGR